jgi:hypothetical protein
MQKRVSIQVVSYCQYSSCSTLFYLSSNRGNLFVFAFIQEKLSNHQCLAAADASNESEYLQWIAIGGSQCH